MKFSLERDALLEPLHTIQGAVERRQTLPILANVLVRMEGDVLSVTATDMEVELMARTGVEQGEGGEITVPARKFIDICRSLPGGAKVDFKMEGEKVSVRSGRSRFTLSSLPAVDYPAVDEMAEVRTVTVAQRQLKRLIELTQFAMAQQDVRYYLNGLLFETGTGYLRTVATDGHRLAMASVESEAQEGAEPGQIIIPRKGVAELLKMLGDSEEPLELAVGSNAIQATFPDMRITSKLIDGRFPDYLGVVPDKERADKEVVVDREAFRQSLARASILSNEKYRAVRLQMERNTLRIIADNPEQERAEDEVGVEYGGEALEVGFNVSYLMDAVGMVPTEKLRMYLTDANSSCLIVPEGESSCEYVVMPMRL